MELQNIEKAPIPARGESSITLGTRTLKLKTSFASLVRIEQAMGCGLIPLLKRAQAMDVRIGDLATIVYNLAIEASERVTLDQVGKLLMQNGMLKNAETIFKALTDSVLAGKEEDPDPNG